MSDKYVASFVGGPMDGELKVLEGPDKTFPTETGSYERATILRDTAQMNVALYKWPGR